MDTVNLHCIHIVSSENFVVYYNKIRMVDKFKVFMKVEIQI